VTIKIYRKVSRIKRRKAKIMRVRYFDKDYPRLEKTTKGDWIDLRSRENVELKVGGHYMIPLGVAVNHPPLRLTP